MIRHVSLKKGETDLQPNCISRAFVCVRVCVRVHAVRTWARTCVCVCARQSCDTRGVNSNPGSLPLFMVDGSQFSEEEEEKRERRRRRRSANMKWRLSDVGSCSEALINISPY